MYPSIQRNYNVHMVGLKYENIKMENAFTKWSEKNHNHHNNKSKYVKQFCGLGISTYTTISLFQIIL